jgi:hypothetical protein
MTPGEWIALGCGEGAAVAWLLHLSFKVGAAIESSNKAKKDADGIAKKVRGALGLIIEMPDLDDKEIRHRATELLEGK